MSIIDFNEAGCKDCYKCVRNCPLKAIRIQQGHAYIMEERCVLCGHCLHVCPQTAKKLNSELDKVQAMVRRGERVIASLAPSYMGLLKYKTLGQVAEALKRLGFYQVRETSEGAAYVTMEYEKLLVQGGRDNIITTCCPSVNDMVELYYPELVPYLAPVVSPMIAHGMLLKHLYGDDVKVVFVGPCIAKMKEAEDDRHPGYVDGVLTFDDLQRWLDQREILIEECGEGEFDNPNPEINRLYPVSSGIVSSVLTTQQKKDSYRKLHISGSKNCMDLCESMIRGDIHGCFIEMNMCTGGCVKGSYTNNDSISRFRAEIEMTDTVEKKTIDRESFEKQGEGLSFEKRFMDRGIHDPVPTEEQIRAILRKVGKTRPEHELNCAACGYPSCREKAVAVFQGKAELNMCIPYLHDKAESHASLVMETTPNLVLIVDADMKIQECSAAVERFFGKTRSEAKEMYLFELLDHTDFLWVLENHQNIYGKKVYYPENELYTLQNIVYLKEENAVLGTIIDITEREVQVKKEYEKKLDTIELAQEVIHKQMMVAQEIAGLLGETTAITKTTLKKLCQSILDDGESGGE